MDTESPSVADPDFGAAEGDKWGCCAGRVVCACAEQFEVGENMVLGVVLLAAVSFFSLCWHRFILLILY